MAERRWQYSSNQQNLDSDSDEADVQHNSSKDSLLNRGFWGTAKFFKLSSKSTRFSPSSEKASSPETETRIQNSHSHGEGVSKVSDSSINNLALFEEFSEIKTVRSLEDQSSVSKRKIRNWRDSFFPQRSKSLSSISLPKSNVGALENLKHPASKLFSYFDFQDNSVPYGEISDSLTKYLWTTENFQDSPNKQEKQKPFETSVTPLLENSKRKNYNQEYNYNSFGTSVDLYAATDHPLLVDEGQLTGNGVYTDISTDIGSDLLGHGSYISHTSSINDSTADFTHSCKSETSVTEISNVIHYQNKVNEFKTKIFPRKLKLKIPTSKTESLPLLSGERQYSIEGFEVPTLDSNRKKTSSMDRPSCLSPSQSDEVEFDSSSTDQTRINANSLESDNLTQENIGDSLKHSTNASFLNNPSCWTNTGNMVLRICARCLNAVLNIRTFGDSLWFPFDVITSNPKVSILSALGSWIVLDLFTLPFWTISTFFVRESLIYITILLAVAFLGRFIIRMIAFPGSSYRVYAEVEKEFTKYSINILDSAASNFCEFAAVILNKSYPNTMDRDNALKNHNLSLPKKNFGKFDVITIYRRAQSFKNRVLGVYLNVLICLFEQNGDGDFSDENSYLNEYGNNRLVGDIGKLNTISMEARKEGRVLYSLLKEIMDNIEELESDAHNILNATMETLPDQIPTQKATESATKLLTSASKLKELLSLMKASSAKSSSLAGLDDTKNENSDGESEDNLNPSGNNNEESTIQTIKSCINTLIPILDPPPHYSIFGLDALRGCMLSRYIGAKQIWVRRPDGGMIDVIHIPSHKTEQISGQTKLKKAVLYCNPNAGLTECATGMSLIGGNVRNDCNPDNCWADFYNDLGFDIFLFNYAGFGRSHGWNEDTRNSYREGVLFRLRRLFCRSFIHFKPTPYSLQTDALSTAAYIMNEVGVETFVIHGESIGGLAAASAARKLTTEIDTALTSKSNVSLLVCDRTFCNLPAVAQRLVGSWTGVVIPLLTPMWTTDVAGDFMKARCPKIVAQDAADIIIHDASSLKTGISISQERLLRVTKNVGLMETAPLEYRMAEWEDVGVTKSSHVKTLRNSVIKAPTWPSDRHISSKQAFHFAACAKRIGKVATAFKKKNQTYDDLKRISSGFEDEEQGIEISYMKHSRNNTLSTNNDPQYSLENTSESVQRAADRNKKRELVMNAWKILACCDGMTGMHCGAAVKQGYDCTVSWLYSTVVYGGQVVVSSAMKRCESQKQQMNPLNENLEIVREDFGKCGQNVLSGDDSLMKPLPIPEVIMHLKKIMEQSVSLEEFEIELRFCISMLEYIEKRLMSKQNINNSVQHLNLERVEEDYSVGCFLKLHCGHNNQYKSDERDKFVSMLMQISNDS